MSRLERSPVKIAGAAILAALSVMMQCLPPIYLTPWFMRIDLVAVPWILCWILFGFKAALLSLLISIPLVGILGPFAGGWVGAIMKSVASIWMFLIPAIFAYKTGARRLLEDKWRFGFASVFAILLRDAACILFNLYFALPVFFGMNVEQVLQFFSRFQSFVGQSLGIIGLGAYVFEVVFWNTLQGIIDIYASLAIGIIIIRRVFRSR